MCLIPQLKRKGGENHLTTAIKTLSKYPNSMPISYMCWQDIYSVVTHLERYCCSFTCNGFYETEIVSLTILDGIIQIRLPPFLSRGSADSWYLFQSIRRKMEDWKKEGVLSSLAGGKRIWIHFCNHFTNEEGCLPDGSCIELRRVVNAVSEALMISDRVTKISFFVDCKPDNWNGVQVFVLPEKLLRNHINGYILSDGNRY